MRDALHHASDRDSLQQGLIQACQQSDVDLAVLQGVAAERICRAFDDVNSRAALRDMGAAAAGRPNALPPILAMGGYAGAEWVEFDPSWSPTGTPGH